MSATSHHMADCARFELVEEIEKEAFKVSKFLLPRTGIRVYQCNVSGPLVKGYFSLATETHDHDGLPHTLEHLVFMGSQKYPFKGVLDKVANRCLSEGTNAYTDVDHTCYTLETAGHEGFLSVLPLYLDHILYPTLTEAAYLTEVHHVNGKGEDAGVVYCEMQDSEPKAQHLIHFKLCEHMYPGRCGYKSNTGGKLADIRNSCSNEKVRAFHKKFYVPSNLYLIICGSIPRDELFEVLFKFEDTILAKGALPPAIDPPPWSAPVPDLEKSDDLRVDFGANDETTGVARIGYRICEGHNVYELSALQMLGEYLTATSAAPVQKFMIDCPDPFANDVFYITYVQSSSKLVFNFASVPTAKLSQLPQRFYTLLKQLGENTHEDLTFNLERMRGIIRQEKKRFLYILEENSHQFLCNACIVDSLYYFDKCLLGKDLDSIANFNKLEKEPIEFWLALLNRYFNEGRHVSCVAVPSQEFAKKSEKEEAERIEKQQSLLGEEGLKKKEEILTKAKSDHQTLIPSDFLNSLPIPDSSKIAKHACSLASNFPSKATGAPKSWDISTDIKLDSFKLPLILTHVKSQFCCFELYFDSTKLPIADKVYFPLLVELLLESPVLRDGKLVPYEQITQQLNEDLVGYSFDIGTSNNSRFKYGSTVECVMLKVTLPIEDSELGVRWLHELCYKTQITEERIRVLLKIMISAIPEFNRSGNKVALELLMTLLYNKNIMQNAGNSLHQKKLLTQLLKDIDSDAGKVVSELNRIRSSLFQLNKVSVHMYTDFLRLKSNPLVTFNNVFKSELSQLDANYSIERHIIKTIKQFRLSPPSSTHGLISGVAGVDSGFFLQQIPLDIKENLVEVCALQVLFSCLSMIEGPLWCEIRGAGLSYGYGLAYASVGGFILFTLQRSAQLAQAYKVSRDIIMGYANGERKISQEEFIAGKNSIVFDFVESVSTFVCVADNAWDSELLPGVIDANLSLELVSKLKLSDVEVVVKKYLPMIFNPMLTRCAVVANPSKVVEVRAQLKELGCELDLVDNVEVFHLGEELGEVHEGSSDSDGSTD